MMAFVEKILFNFAGERRDCLLLTVIIPVYKTEDTLDRCVESVLCQVASGDMEVILVDDGSPDSCPALCDAWAERDSRIRVIHQHNSGLGAARNAGLDIATGEYVTFADSDDYLAADTFPRLMQRLAEQPDVDILEYEIRQTREGVDELTLTDEIYPNARRYWLQTRAWWHSYAWNKIYRRRLFDDIRYADDRFCEDMQMLVWLLERQPVVATAHLGAYVYVWNTSGLTANVTAKKIRELLETLLYARKTMRMSVFSRNGLDFYRTVLYRQIDLYKASGEVLLHWPFVRLICWLHQKMKG